MIKHQERDQTVKNIEVEKSELEKIPRDHRKHIFLKTAATKKKPRKQKVKK